MFLTNKYGAVISMTNETRCDDRPRSERFDISHPNAYILLAKANETETIDEHGWLSMSNMFSFNERLNYLLVNKDNERNKILSDLLDMSKPVICCSCGVKLPGIEKTLTEEDMYHMCPKCEFNLSKSKSAEEIEINNSKHNKACMKEYLGIK